VQHKYEEIEKIDLPEIGNLRISQFWKKIPVPLLAFMFLSFLFLYLFPSHCFEALF